MGLTTYSELKATIEATAHRDDVRTRIDDFIDMCEADMWRMLRIREMDTRATATISTSDRFLALPDSFLEMRKFRLRFTDSNSVTTYYGIDYRPPESMEVWPTASRPCFYTITSQIEFDRTSDIAYVAEMQYWKSLTALSSSNTSNAVLTRFPYLYLYGSLFHLYMFTLQEDKAAIYKAYFESLIADVNEQEDTARYGTLPAAIIEGSTP